MQTVLLVDSADHFRPIFQTFYGTVRMLRDAMWMPYYRRKGSFTPGEAFLPENNALYNTFEGNQKKSNYSVLQMEELRYIISNTHSQTSVRHKVFKVMCPWSPQEFKILSGPYHQISLKASSTSKKTATTCCFVKCITVSCFQTKLMDCSREATVKSHWVMIV